MAYAPQGTVGRVGWIRQVLLDPRSGEVGVEMTPPPVLEPGGMLVRTCNSLVSVGTERSKVQFGAKSLLQKARNRPDLVRQVLSTARREGLASTFRKVTDRLETPEGLGYSSAGIVEQVADDVTELHVGDRVACAGTYANHAERVFVPINLCCRVPDEVTLEQAAFTTVGAIALQGVRQADARIGESVCVIGLGLVGLLVAQILKASGCMVYGVDLDRSKLGMAERLGVAKAWDARHADVAREVMAATAGRGVDCVLLTAQTSSNEPVVLAGEIARDKGRVVVLGAFPIDLPRSSFYEKELELRLSRSYGPGRYDEVYERHGIDYPYGYVRWTEKRNMAAFLEMVSAGQVDVNRLITHRRPLAEAADAYRLLKEGKETVIAIVFQYPEEKSVSEPPTCQNLRPQSDAEAHIGLIGAGNFAQTHRLPYLKRHATSLQVVVTRRGHHASFLEKKWGFADSACDPQAAIDSPAVSAVVIATRHGSHAELICRGLDAGKSVFVEKPLALSLDDLRAVYQSYRKSRGKLVVGYNRRFSEAAARAREHLADAGPMMIQYRINNSVLPSSHWVNDPIDGGGRVLGECCHFVDLLCYLSGAVPTYVFMVNKPGASEEMSASIQLSDGSVGSIVHVAQGSTLLGKERIEIFAGAKFALIEDFTRVTLGSGDKASSLKTSGKGHEECVTAFCDYVAGKCPPPIPDGQLFLAALATLKLPAAASAAEPVRVGWDDLAAEYGSTPGTL